jgi:hypothetical protein
MKEKLEEQMRSMQARARPELRAGSAAPRGPAGATLPHLVAR